MTRDVAQIDFASAAAAAAATRAAQIRHRSNSLNRSDAGTDEDLDVRASYADHSFEDSDEESYGEGRSLDRRGGVGRSADAGQDGGGSSFNAAGAVRGDGKDRVFILVYSHENRVAKLWSHTPSPTPSPAERQLYLDDRLVVKRGSLLVKERRVGKWSLLTGRQADGPWIQRQVCLSVMGFSMWDIASSAFTTLYFILSSYSDLISYLVIIIMPS